MGRIWLLKIRSSLGSSSDGWWLAAVVLSALTAWASGRPPGLRRSVRLARRWECERAPKWPWCAPLRLTGAYSNPFLSCGTRLEDGPVLADEWKVPHT